MGRKYKKNQSGANSSMGRMAIIMVSLIIGYLGAAFFDVSLMQRYLNIAQNWFNHQLPDKPVAVAKPVVLPKPKFEFYTLLTKDPEHKVPQATPAPVVASNVKPVQVAPTAPVIAPEVNIQHKELVVNKDTYMLQVASFKNRSEADRMKAVLVMKGLDVSIVQVAQQQVNWYRVMIGPFASKVQAQKAQTEFAAREHVMGMIRRA